MSDTKLGFGDGDACNREGCKGVIDTHPSENCSCHISPPCSACTAPRNFCPECDWHEKNEPETEVVNDWLVKKGTWEPVRPRPLDSTRVDYHNKAHTHFSMIREGVYPQSGDDAADRDMVRKLVDGTFGGRFEYFKDGKFKFIAYTD